MKRSVKHIQFVLICFPVFFQAYSLQARIDNGDSLNCVMQMETYREMLVRHDTLGAVAVWRQVFHTCPAISEDIYMEGAVMLDYLMARTWEQEARRQLLDSLMFVYDRRIAYFGREGYVLGRKGVELLLRDSARFEEAFWILNKSVSMEGFLSRPPILVNYFNTACRLAEAGKLDTVVLLQVYLDCRQMLASALADKYIQPNLHQEAVKTMDIALHQYLDCERIVLAFDDLLKKDSMNPAVLEPVLRALEHNHCVLADKYLKLAKRLYDLDSTAANALRLGSYFARKGIAPLAMPVLLKALKSGDSLIMAKGQLYTAMVNCSEDRAPYGYQHAANALALDPSEGYSLIIQGDCYALSKGFCGKSDYYRKMVFCLAVEKYQEALEQYPDIASIARFRIRQYSALFPEEKEILEAGMKEGQEFLVTCWIYQKTTVRARKK
ncbi:MAG TPA: hypothetical protein P5531_13665 [Bacteroidales bacterium]|nr:hypothetical protein [Bacteroidales bacterium]HSA44615.1 hypothetical protein [Bacteroidales bacterium]